MLSSAADPGAALSHGSGQFRMDLWSASDAGARILNGARILDGARILAGARILDGARILNGVRILDGIRTVG